MLYFTETGWTVPDIMKVSEDFDRDYDQHEYEEKIAKLVTKVDRHIRKGPRDDYDRWWAAIRFLQREDHYISVMIRLAGLRPRGDQLRLFATGLGIATCPPHVDLLLRQIQHPYALSGRRQNFRMGCPRQFIRCLHASPIRSR